MYALCAAQDIFPAERHYLWGRDGLLFIYVSDNGPFHKHERSPFDFLTPHISYRTAVRADHHVALSKIKYQGLELSMAGILRELITVLYFKQYFFSGQAGCNGIR